MGISVAAQGRAVVQALALGAMSGVLYDLFRILRVRVHVRLLGSILDLLFWLCVTGVLFLWSLDAWGGRIRLYGAACLLIGGLLYFRLLSPVFLKLGYHAADLITLLLRLLILPITGVVFLLKKIKIFTKNI